MHGRGTDRLVVVMRSSNGAERRGRVVRVRLVVNRVPGRSQVSESRSQGKPFDISRHLVWEAYLRVKANKGAAGVDGVSVSSSSGI